jgi:transcriptional regulator with XRE-family HTH domain
MSEEMEQKELNLVKKTCKELGITQKELAEKIGVAPYTITRWAKGEIDKTNKVLLDALIYKKKFLDLQNILINTQNTNF